MGYEITWLVESRIVYAKMYGTVTREETMQFRDDITRAINSGTPDVHVVTHAAENVKNTMSLSDLISLFKQSTRNPKQGWSIYVSPNQINRFFATVVAQMTKTRTREFAALEDAIAFLKASDHTLPAIPLSPIEPRGVDTQVS
jgi:hypothetical protein